MKTNIHFIISRSIFLRMRNFSDSFVENIKTHFVFNNFLYKNRAVYEIMWKNTVQPGRPLITIQRMRIACLIPKAANTQSEYVILIVFPLQPWLNERASMLRCVSCYLSFECQPVMWTNYRTSLWYFQFFRALVSSVLKVQTLKWSHSCGELLTCCPKNFKYFKGVQRGPLYKSICVRL
jgi:hypothetical protein